ncbi:MAG: 50S ribosomal protein L13 [Candidatus Jacksonbacteria bacterium RIFOXYC2_FULL_44_29]|nr:MAG: 50S ribosomal protein L13 [Parcubacteria group bacterium GW2011_GWA2_42_28]KKT55453.1 MAG: 50S ribosomal protein L13 [Parcubacteria group bacterium GW2011_GWC2_44_22]OGY75237.1 MAG: 50S ribosomal protein L13 [Candidatus Jacksonbacteria bacterium RIFOXYA2_FULL_43_12]OGY75940.1 MAG: 50S ribosomal protein L13 [Candidatus Jacksonbacteria bacterium RIFOXYB2_FULL_44_15]OGY77955.1 MAG: 50S ribosomal protein L13 [Candidatus Jacksonbacteria bacterium RIFOXYC2_FULL_44_29]OGY80541.1 MAG: 50S ribo
MIKIDANNLILGRVATEIATYLLGKHRASYVPYKITGEIVEVNNSEKIVVTGKKMLQKNYYHHTGYPGHLKTIKMKELSKADLLRQAVWNMLPKNKLRVERFKLLKLV